MGNHVSFNFPLSKKLQERIAVPSVWRTRWLRGRDSVRGAVALGCEIYERLT